MTIPYNRPALRGGDWCQGCADTPEDRRVYLPEDWQPGDPIPDDVTRHATFNEGPRSFVFKGGQFGERVFVS